MVHHQKAASCSALPSFSSLSATPTQTRPSLLANDKPFETDMSTLFPLPSFCIYSQRALLNEYAPESDIIQFLYPVSTVLQERLPMLVGVLQSLFTVVNDMYSKDEDDDNDSQKQQSDLDTDNEDDDQEEESPFTIIGLNTMKLVIWNSMYHRDLSLVIFASSHLTDKHILYHMQLLRESVSNDIPPGISLTASQIGDYLNASCNLLETFTHV